MLILKVYVNENQIDEIWIHNTGNRHGEGLAVWEYRIRKPEGYDHIPIYHIRDDGYNDLVIYALEILEHKEWKKDGDQNKKD